LSGIPMPSLNDCFWIGQDAEARHPCVEDAIIAIVNRRRKKSVHDPSKSLWQQPLYMVQRRNSTYLCACASVENGSLVVHSYSKAHRRAERFRNHVDAELFGQIVTIVRRM